MSGQPIEGSSDSIHKVLQQLFQGHGVEADVQSGFVTFPAQPALWVNGELFRSFERIVQFDVRLGGFDGDRVLIESIAGIGADLNAQANFAIQAFANASFHVWLTAFFGQPLCDGTDREKWLIGGPRTVYTGLITSVFGFPPPLPDGSPDLGFFPAFKCRLETYPLPQGTLWIRIYQMRHNGNVMGNEVLLDCHLWQEMQDFLAVQPWPLSEKLYDVRVFLVVKDLE